MGQKLLLWLLRYAWLPVVVGLGLPAAGAYFSYVASHGGGLPAEAELTTAQGYAEAAREVTEERRRRKSGPATTRQFYEIDLQPEGGGATLVLRLGKGATREHAQAALEERIRVRYDATDHNRVYDLAQLLDDTPLPVFTYDEMAARAIAAAEKERDVLLAPNMLRLSLFLVLLGAAGMRTRRRLLKAEAERAS